MAAALLSLKEIEKCADVARDAINARLKLLPEGELADFWEIVAKGYCNAAPLTSFDTATNLLDEAIGALRIAGHIVQRPVAEIGEYRIDNGPPLRSGQVIALAWDTGLMDEFD